MCRDLLRCDGPSYEGYITSWQSQDCLLQRVMAQGSQLLSGDTQHWIGVGGSGGNSGIVKYEGPIFTC